MVKIMNIIKLIRDNKLLTLGFALCVGLFYHFSFGLIKNYLLLSFFNFISHVFLTCELEAVVLTLSINLIIDLISSLIAAILPGALFVYIIRRQVFFYSLISITVFLTLNSRLWKFWKAPDLGMQISALLGPILAALIFVGSIWLFFKINNHKDRKG